MLIYNDGVPQTLMRVTNRPIFVFTDTVNKPVKIKNQKVIDVIIKRTEEYYKTRTFDWRIE